MRWTKEPPTEPGFYWQRISGAECFESVVRVYLKINGKLRCKHSYGDKLVSRFIGHEWSDTPVPAPKE